jgi:hypothetical protein
MEIIWTDNENGCPMFGTIVGTEKIEDNFIWEHINDSISEV